MAAGLKVSRSWGIASARHTSGLCMPRDDKSSPGYFDVPQGPSLVRWDILSRKKLWSFQPHDDAVFCHRLSPNGEYIVTLSYSGEIAVWTTKYEKLCFVSKAVCTSLHHVSWSFDSTRIALVGNGFDSRIAVYKLEHTDGKDGCVGLTLEWQHQAGNASKEHFGQVAQDPKDKKPQEKEVKPQEKKVKPQEKEVKPQEKDVKPQEKEVKSQEKEVKPHETKAKSQGSREEQVASLHGSSLSPDPTNVLPSSVGAQRFSDAPPLPAFETCEFLPAGGVVATEMCPNNKCNLLHVYSSDGKLLKLVELMPEQSEKQQLGVILATVSHNGVFLIGLQGGYVMVFDDSTANLVASFCIGVTPRTCIWDEKLLLFPLDSGKLSWWCFETGQCVKEVSGILEQDYFARIAWDVPGKSLFVCGFTTLSHITLTKEAGKIVDAQISQFEGLDGRKTKGVVSQFQISCCGLDFSPSGDKVAVGDLVGTVWACPTVGDDPILAINVGMSVRCLVWLDEETVIVGTLDGLIHIWDVGCHVEPLVAQHLEGSVLHMRWAHGSKRLGVGSSHGVLHVYSWTGREPPLKETKQFLAHPPHRGEHNPHFGQLDKQAEIWSLCWSPDDHMIVTCSEDQTSKVWDTSSWNLVATLRGHTMAVTSVDWKIIAGKSLIATCADDRTVRLVDGKSFELQRIVNTKDIHGWHTLTYLAFSPVQDSPELACVTQNGHLVVWDAVSGSERLRAKIHCGSVEGLKWIGNGNGNRLSTCAADCVLLLLSVDK